MHKFGERQERPDYIKLPKIELKAFSEDKLKWPEFCLNAPFKIKKKLKDIEKFTHLQSKLVAEAKPSISGLSLSNDNYKIAITKLKECYENKQEIIDLHNSKMMDLAPPNTRTEFAIFLGHNRKALEMFRSFERKH